jgi:lysozyme
MNLRPVPEIAVAFVELEEDGPAGPRLEAYLDPAGIWTIATGHTPAHAGQKVTLQEARVLLRTDLATGVSRLAHCLAPPVITALNDWEYGALISFAFNAGANPAWAIWKAVPNAHAVAGELQKFVVAGRPPERLKGLENRRLAEIALYEGAHPLCKVYPAHSAPP